MKTELHKNFRALPPASLLNRIEKATSQSLKDLQSESLAAKRIRVEKSKESALKITRNFPVIGRGCVMGGRLKTRAELNKELDKALER